ncbi:MAG TPA: DUF373 family protein [Methanocella sp.]|uniref:DUF373 family protein n=1 Tax=Methanocella sp. TaxID=2052833 RepID=UPI002C2771FD|nr:DUF373 family protein [Methanocella sp.]HTY90397.1 DUF373 family protein [Methanocella sp.]
MDILVICIDKDDDLGVKAGVKSPVIGREACLEAAGKLGIADPEESDTNTIFGGIQAYDQMRAEGHNVELVCITGHRELGIKSDRAIASQLDDILLKYPTERAILVSDGAEDESVMPILQSRLKIESVKRVVVKQAQNLESTYYIIKQLINDPKVAKVVFIPIGLILLVYAATTWIDWPNATPVAIALLLGGYLLYRGLGIDILFDTFIFNLNRSFKESKLTFVTYLLSLVLTIMAFIMGAWGVATWQNDLPNVLSPGLLDYAAIFVSHSVLWFSAAFLAIIIGWIVDAYMDESDSLYRYLSTPFFLLAGGLLIWGSAQYIIHMANTLQAFESLGISIVLAVAVSFIGVQFANLIRQIMQYRTVEVIDF